MEYINWDVFWTLYAVFALIIALATIHGWPKASHIKQGKLLTFGELKEGEQLMITGREVSLKAVDNSTFSFQDADGQSYNGKAKKPPFGWDGAYIYLHQPLRIEEKLTLTVTQGADIYVELNSGVGGIMVEHVYKEEDVTSLKLNSFFGSILGLVAGGFLLALIMELIGLFYNVFFYM
jgi:hypothetical protein